MRTRGTILRRGPAGAPAPPSRMRDRGSRSGRLSCRCGSPRWYQSFVASITRQVIHDARQELRTTRRTPDRGRDRPRGQSPLPDPGHRARGRDPQRLHRGDPELGVTELAERVGLHKSTVHRFMVNLDAAGLVERNARTGRYRLGLHIFELGGPGHAADEPLGRGPALPGGPGARHRRDRPPGGPRRGRGDLHRARRGPAGPAGPLGHRPRLPGPRDEPGQGAAGGPAARARRRDRRRARPGRLHAQHDHRPRTS